MRECAHTILEEWGLLHSMRGELGGGGERERLGGRGRECTICSEYYAQFAIKYARKYADKMQKICIIIFQICRIC
jgi:hypothetical protein